MACPSCGLNRSATGGDYYRIKCISREGHDVIAAEDRRKRAAERSRTIVNELRATKLRMEIDEIKQRRRA